MSEISRRQAKNIIEEIKNKLDAFCEKYEYDEVFFIYYPPDSPMAERSVDELFNFIINYEKGKEGFTKYNKIAIFLHSYGGNASSAYMMIKIFRGIANEIHGYVLTRAKSAATLFMLGTDKIYMGPTSELGPIDPLVTHPVLNAWVPAKAITEALEKVLPSLRVTPEAPPLTVLPIDPAHVSFCHLALEDSKRYAKLLLEKYNLKNNPGKSDEVARTLAETFPSHDFALDYDVCADIGLNVEKMDINEWREIWEIYKKMRALSKNLVGNLIKRLSKTLKAEKEKASMRELIRKIGPFIIATRKKVSLCVQEEIY
ncbi:MAG: hypothetical protein DRJ67_01710 [Thermoprotei archaeon]|nr:MAG: hypothetical protein DRJ67_01710 [Thermoprotei archaeon]